MGEDIITRTFVRLKERLIVQANSVLLDFSSAEDVVMDAFLKVFDKKYQVDTDAAAEHLLATMCGPHTMMLLGIIIPDIMTQP